MGIFGKLSQVCLLGLTLDHFFPWADPTLRHAAPLPSSPCPSQKAGVPAAPNLACVFTAFSSLCLIFPFWYSLTSEAGVVGIAGDIFPSGLQAADSG